MLLEQRRRNKIQHCGPTGGDALGGKGIDAGDEAQNRRVGEVKGNDRDHGGDEVLGIHGAEHSRGLTLLNYSSDFAKHRDEILFRNTRQLRRAAVSRTHHFVLRDPGIEMMGGDVVKVRAHIGQQLLPGGRSFDNAFSMVCLSPPKTWSNTAA